MSQENDGIEVIVSVLATGPGDIRAAAALLSCAERNRAQRFVFDRDRRLFIAARAQLRRLLAARLAQEPDSIEIAYGPHGKPALARRYERDCRFNVSHHADVAVYAFSNGKDVGIDIEAIRDVPGAHSMAAHFFTRREQEEYQSLEADDRRLGFLNWWTRKEAFVKALGQGLSYPLDCFDVSLAPGAPAMILRLMDTPGDRCGWRLRSFVPAPGFVGAIVTEDRRSSASRGAAWAFPLNLALAS